MDNKNNNTNKHNKHGLGQARRARYLASPRGAALLAAAVLAGADECARGAGLVGWRGAAPRAPSGTCAGAVPFAAATSWAAAAAWRTAAGPMTRLTNVPAAGCCRAAAKEQLARGSWLRFGAATGRAPLAPGGGGSAGLAVGRAALGGGDRDEWPRSAVRLRERARRRGGSAAKPRAVVTRIAAAAAAAEGGGGATGRNQCSHWLPNNAGVSKRTSPENVKPSVCTARDTAAYRAPGRHRGGVTEIRSRRYTQA